jgi:hypothetical protein
VWQPEAAANSSSISQNLPAVAAAAASMHESSTAVPAVYTHLACTSMVTTSRFVGTYGWYIVPTYTCTIETHKSTCCGLERY